MSEPRLFAAYVMMAVLLVVCAVTSYGWADKSDVLLSINKDTGQLDRANLASWGAGKAEVDETVQYLGRQALRVETRGLHEGGRLSFQLPMDLSAYLEKPENAYLDMWVKIPEPQKTATGGGPGTGEMPGMMGPGMGPGMMGPGMGPGMMGPGMGGEGGAMQPGMGPGMMGPGMMGPGMMQPGMGGEGGTMQPGMGPGMMGPGGQPGAGPGMMGPGMGPGMMGPGMGPGMMGPGMGPGMMGPGMGGEGGAMQPGMGPGMMGPGMMGPGMMGPGMMGPGMMGPGMMGPGVMEGEMGEGGMMGPGMGPGMMGPGMMGGEMGEGGMMMGPGMGGMMPGIGAPGTAKEAPPKKIASIRALLVTTEGLVDSGAIDAAPYLQGHPDLSQEGGWVRLSIPLSEFEGAKGKEGAALEDVALFGDQKGKFYVGSLRLVEEEQPLRADAGPDRVVKVGQEVKFTALDQPGGGKARYAWDFDDLVEGIGEDALGQEATFTFGEAGFYKVTLTVTDPDGHRVPQYDRINVTVQ